MRKDFCNMLDEDIPTIPTQNTQQRIVCCVCGKQVLRDGNPGRYDKYVTTIVGAKAGFGSEVFCGYCAEELDDDGLFPNEG